MYARRTWRGTGLGPCCVTEQPGAETAPAVLQQLPRPALVQSVAKAAQSFLDALDDAARVKAAYAFDDSERVRLAWTTPGGFPRNGLPLREDDRCTEETGAFAVGSERLSAGYEKAVNIMGLQTDLGNDPELYYVTVFGVPGEGLWGWRWEGHHLSRQFTIAGDEIAMTPFFLGAWPSQVCRVVMRPCIRPVIYGFSRSRMNI